MFKKGTYWANFVRSELIKGTDYGYGLYRKYAIIQEKEGYRPLTYQSFMKNIYYLRKLGLIRRGKTEPALDTGYDRQYFQIVRKKIDDPAWDNPKKALFGG